MATSPATKSVTEMEAEITQAMLARATDFKNQAGTLTPEGVRRALEIDLGMKKFSLDAYKKFIKKCVSECLFGDDDDDDVTISKISEKTEEKALQPEQEETTTKHEHLQSGDSPTLNEMKPEDHVSEDMIKGALKKRAAYIRANIEKISPAEVRRLLEGDLKLEPKVLDAFKKFIGTEIDEVLSAPEEAIEAANGMKNKIKKGTQSKERKKMTPPSKSTSRDSESMGSDDVLSGDEESSEERRPKKRPRQKLEASTKPLKRQKKTVEGSKSSSSTKKKVSDLDVDNSSAGEGGNASDGSHSRSSADEKIKKKPEKPTQAYGKQVEHLRSIIKACGMGITPAVYKKAKQAPESKREAVLIKELEEILRKEGLSTNPSEKEIKFVKKSKTRAKELEGIDMSNIVSSSRRRNTSSYIPIAKPNIEVESDDEADNEDDEDDVEDADDGGESSDESGQDAEDESD